MPDQLAPPILDQRFDLLKRQGIERRLAKDLTVSDILVGQLVVVGQHHDLVQDHLPTWWTIHLFCLKDRAIVRTDHIKVKVLIFGSFLHLMAWSLLLLLQVRKVFVSVSDPLMSVSLGLLSLDRFRCLHLVTRFNFNVIKLDQAAKPNWTMLQNWTTRVLQTGP